MALYSRASRPPRVALSCFSNDRPADHCGSRSLILGAIGALMTADTTKAKPRQRVAARPIVLLGGPKSPEATALVEHLLHDHVLPAHPASLPADLQKTLKPSSVSKRRKVIGALLADLLQLLANPKPGRECAAGMHGSSGSDFTAAELGFAHGVFMDVMGRMATSGLLKVTKGAPRWHPAFDTFVVKGGDLTTYRLTPMAVALVEQRGIKLADWATHWQLKSDQVLRTLKPKAILELRSKAQRINGKKRDAEPMRIDHGLPEVRKIVRDVAALNGFLVEQDVGGIAFPGLRRVFNDGDQPGFRWNKGGRYYSLAGGHSYESMGSDMRRALITLKGEAVDEVDLRASHLTLLHALMQRPFDQGDDAYTIPDLPRPVVKAWVSQAIGSSRPRPVRWSQRVQKDYEEERPGRWLSDEYVITDVGREVKARHPLLTDLDVCGYGPLDLMYHEAEILRLAMEDLMLTQGIPVLPMHDAIIAPRSALRKAEDALKRAFAVHVEGVTGNPSMVLPKVTWKGREA